MSPSLDPRLVRQLKNACTLARCGKPLKDGSAWCEEHDPEQRAKAAVRQAKRRSKLARKKLCIEGCGSPVTRASRGKRCSNCTQSNRERASAWRECHAESENVTPEPSNRGFTKVEQTEAYTSERYVGRARRGAPSREDLDIDLIKDVTTAKTEIDKFTRAFEIARSEHVKTLGRVQQKEARDIARNHLEYAARFLDSVIEALGG